MAPTAALVTVREPDGRTVYINQERMAELFIQALGDQYRHRVVPRRRDHAEADGHRGRPTGASRRRAG